MQEKLSKLLKGLNHPFLTNKEELYKNGVLSVKSMVSKEKDLDLVIEAVHKKLNRIRNEYTKNALEDCLEVLQDRK